MIFAGKQASLLPQKRKDVIDFKFNLGATLHALVLIAAASSLTRHVVIMVEIEKSAVLVTTPPRSAAGKRSCTSITMLFDARTASKWTVCVYAHTVVP